MLGIGSSVAGLGRGVSVAGGALALGLGVAGAVGVLVLGVGVGVAGAVLGLGVGVGSTVPSPVPAATLRRVSAPTGCCSPEMLTVPLFS